MTDNLLPSLLSSINEIKYYYDDWPYNGLIGGKILSYYLSNDKTVITFRFEDKSGSIIILYYKADSCGGNSAWIESIDGIDDILNHKIIKIIDHDGESLRDNVPYGLVFNIEIVTEKSCCVIDFRSNCNGYYGANLSLMQIDIGHRSIVF